MLSFGLPHTHSQDRAGCQSIWQLCTLFAFLGILSVIAIYRQSLTNESISGYSPGRCAEVDNDSVQLLKCSSEYVLHGLPYALWQF